VDRFGDEFLAGAALALDENRGTAGRDLRYKVEDLEHDLALAHDISEVITLLEGTFELQVLFFALWRATAERMSARSFSLSQGF